MQVGNNYDSDSMVYTVQSKSSVIVGVSIATDVLVRHLRTLEESITIGVYGDVDMSIAAFELKRIYSLGDLE